MTAPEIELWTEVIFQAIEDFIGASRNMSKSERSRCQHDATNWFASNSCAAGSFRFAAQAIDIDPSVIRRGLRIAVTAELQDRLKGRTNLINRPYTDALSNPNFDCTTGRHVGGAPPNF